MVLLFWFCVENRESVVTWSMVPGFIFQTVVLTINRNTQFRIAGLMYGYITE